MTLGENLEREHIEIDGRITSFGAGLAADELPTAAVVGALDDLRRHIYFEEELLFPALHEVGLVPPLVVMRQEHGEIWAIMDALTDGLTSGVDGSHLRKLVDRLVAQLHEHNEKEEAVIYPAADQMIAAPAQEALIAKLADLQLPAAWVCEAAR